MAGGFSASHGAAANCGAGVGEPRMKTDAAYPVLSAKQTHDPMPHADKPPRFATPSFVIRLATLLLSPAPRKNLLFRPSLTPVDPTPINPIVGFAGKLPIADRRAYAWTLRGFFNRPFRWPKRRADLLHAAAGTKVHRRIKLLCDVEKPGLQRPGHVLHPLQFNPVELFHSQES